MQLEINQNINYIAFATRCSSDEQAIDGYSIETQISECNKKFKEIPNAVLYNIFSDEGLSGSDSYLKRPELLKMLADAKAKKFKILIIWKADRLGRLSDEREQIILTLHKYGIEIISCSGENLMDNTPTGKFTRKTLANVDELEVGILAMRIKATMNTIIESGEWKGGSLPYSYKWIRDNNSKKSLGIMQPISDNHVEQVKKIYELYVYNLMGFNAIRDYMNENNYPYYNKNGSKGKFNKDHIKSILKCPIYCGFQYNNNVYTKFEARPDGIKQKPREEWELHPINFVKPIITKEMFDMVQEIMQKKASKTMTITKTTWLLTGILTCNHCNTPMSGHPMRTKYTRKKDGSTVEYDSSFYKCAGTARFGREYCKMKQVPKKLLEQKVISSTLEYISILKQYVSKEIMNDINKTTRKFKNSNQTKLLSIDKELEKIDKGLNKAVNEWQNDRLETPAYNLLTKDYFRRKEELELEKFNIEKSLESQPNIKEELNNLNVCFERWEKSLSEIDYTKSRSIMYAKATLIQLIEFMRWNGESLDIQFLAPKQLVNYLYKDGCQPTGRHTEIYSKINAIQNLFNEDINNVFNFISMRGRLVAVGE